MRQTLILLFFLFGISSFSQSVNDYKAVIIPLKYDFQKEQNQFRLQTLIKINLQKNGFQAFYSNEVIPAELNDRCKLLTLDLIKESSFLSTKLILVFKDCYGLEMGRSEVGKSREKEFEGAYKEALESAFKTLKFDKISNPAPISELKIVEKKEIDLLYAQATSNGYQLIDNVPKVVMKVYKTSNTTVFIAVKENIQGILIAKENNWIFEYYQNDQLVSEKVDVKF